MSALSLMGATLLVGAALGAATFLAISALHCGKQVPSRAGLGLFDGSVSH